MNVHPDNWQTPQNILVILAHPDDPEFFCGGTLARWARAGHEITYVLLTCGEKGSRPDMSRDETCSLRQKEQRAAAQVIGVKNLRFLSYEDGYLIPTIDIRKEIVRVIRQEKPDILITSDPTNFFIFNGHINHPDHRYAGQVVLDAVFPAAGNPQFFPELLKTERLEPHTPHEIWVALASQPNTTIDITGTWKIKLQALKEHKSQIGDALQFEEKMKQRHAKKSYGRHNRYEEAFFRAIIR